MSLLFRVLLDLAGMGICTAHLGWAVHEQKAIFNQCSALVLPVHDLSTRTTSLDQKQTRKLDMAGYDLTGSGCDHRVWPHFLTLTCLVSTDSLLGVVHQHPLQQIHCLDIRNVHLNDSARLGADHTRMSLNRCWLGQWCILITRTWVLQPDSLSRDEESSGSAAISGEIPVYRGTQATLHWVES